MPPFFYISIMLVTILFSPLSEVRADEQDHLRSDVEIYGNIHFLKRIAIDEKFAPDVSEATPNALCQPDTDALHKTLSSALEAEGHLIAPGNKARFKIELDFFAGGDQTNHCLLGYEIYISRSQYHNQQGEDVLERGLQHESGNPLLEISGILHTSKNQLDALLQKEAGEATNILLTTLKNIRSKLETAQ